LVPHVSSIRTQAAAGTVIIACPGGLENGGGIGRQMGYFLHEQEARRQDLAYRVVDTRGPWFLGKSPVYTVFAVFYLALAVGRLVAARFSSVPSVAHINITGRGSTVRKAVLVTTARALGLRYLLHVHDYDYAAEYVRRGPLLRFLIRGMFRGAAKVLVLGARDQQALTQVLQLPPGRISVLHNAVPDPRPDDAKARPDAACHLVFLGYLSARKGVPELLQALADPALLSRPWRATLAGGGPVDDFRRLAATLGLTERVEFPGWIDQSAAKGLCAGADVLVLPSHAEGLAMAVLEGLSHGLAVIATPVGAHGEVIEPDVSGLLVPPGDVGALADALVRVIDDDALRDRLRAGARRRFLEKFDVRGYADRLSRLHASLLVDCRDVEAIGKEQTL
jgi:glycosyltransferase involved in cell wall biosynthesis